MKGLFRKTVVFFLAAIMVLQGVTPVFAEDSPLKRLAREKQKKVHYAKDYQEIYDSLKTVTHYYPYVDYAMEDVLEYETDGAMYAAEESAMGDTAAMPQASASAKEDSVPAAETAESGYSETNTRDQSVDEADIVKTDGQYIYSVQNNDRLVIVKADGGDLTEISSTSLKADGRVYSRSVQDFYLDGDRLLLVSSDMIHNEKETKAVYRYTSAYTSLYTYDISDRSRPVLLGTVYQEGDYMESRKKDGIVYLFSEYYPDIELTMEDSSFIPTVNGEEIPANQMAIPAVVNDSELLVVSSVNMEDPENVIDTDVLVSGGNSLYVSGNSIYSLNADWNRDRTEIVRQDYKDGEIECRYSCFVKGSVKDSFCIDEYNGYLRVLSNYYQSSDGLITMIMEEVFGYYDGYTRKNALTIFDSELQQVGAINGIARNEQLKSARFTGDTAYFVTFRNTDPLFSVDLSDPKKPKIKGELVVSGFSTYMHPYGNGRMVGFGYEADVNYGGITGLKISLFDTSVMEDMKELSRAVLPGVTYCPAIENYKSVFAAPEKNLLGFFCDNRYFLYSLTDQEIERSMIYDFYQDELQDNSYSNLVRGLYIGEYFYIVGSGYIISFSLKDFSRLQVLKLTV